jgi:hypothetical protein
MTILRLNNGSDTIVELSVEETLERLRAGGADGSGFVELPAEEGPFHVRPSGVIALFAHSTRGSAGFRMPVGGTAR